jgi:hypothetical protein
MSFEQVPLLLEMSRGCGYRKIGGVYLVCPAGAEVICGRFPYLIKPCPVCGERIRQTRGYQWITMSTYFEGNCQDNSHECHSVGCPVCFSDTLEKCLCMWIGKQHYTPESFLREAINVGVSKRIPVTGKVKEVPEGLEIGYTWCLLAHPQAGEEITTTKEGKTKIKKVPAFFMAFKPSAIEIVVSEEQAKNEKYITDLRERGFTPVRVKPLQKENPEKTKELDGNHIGHYLPM